MTRNATSKSPKWVIGPSPRRPRLHPILDALGWSLFLLAAACLILTISTLGQVVAAKAAAGSIATSVTSGAHELLELHPTLQCVLVVVAGYLTFNAARGFRARYRWATVACHALLTEPQTAVEGLVLLQLSNQKGTYATEREERRRSDDYDTYCEDTLRIRADNSAIPAPYPEVKANFVYNMREYLEHLHAEMNAARKQAAALAAALLGVFTANVLASLRLASALG